jgi:SAM-dependent methyltransferase
MESFGKDYLKYWKEAVQKSVDGTIIAGPAVLNEYLKKIQINPTSRILDLGCSFGRMHDALSLHSSNIFGVDLEMDVINEATKKSYTALAVGKAESIPFPSSYFDGVVSWGVFDVVDQRMALLEVSRILRKNGWLLFTGKNSNYHNDDTLGFAAERNAKLKGFPNRFTDLKKLTGSIRNFGFEIKQFYIFARRGDMGLNKPAVSSDDLENFKGYEYILILEKISEPSPELTDTLTSEFSATAREKAMSAGFKDDILSFFSIDKEKEKSM